MYTDRSRADHSLVTEFGRTVRGLLLLVVLLRLAGRAELRAGLVAHRNAQAGAAQAVARLRRHDVHFRAAHAFLLRFTWGKSMTKQTKKDTVSILSECTDFGFVLQTYLRASSCGRAGCKRGRISCCTAHTSAACHLKKGPRERENAHGQ